MTSAGTKAPEGDTATSRAASCLRPALELDSVKLRPTQTRVRTRGGTILRETRSACGGFEATVVGQGAAQPQYVLDQEAGISRLTPKVYDALANRWVASTPRDAAADARARDDAAPTAFRLVSYNVWFSPFRQRARARALLDLLRRERAHVVCLQEVTPTFLGWVRDEAWVREGYQLSDAVGTTLRGASLAYGVVMLVSRDVAVRSLRLRALPTRMNRAALVLRGALGARGLVVATAHLESLGHARARVAQLGVVLDALVDEEAGAAARGADGAEPLRVFAGDCNFDDGAEAEEACAAARGFVDVWRALAHDGEDGCTMPHDDATGGATRIDRVFGLARAGLAPTAMKRLGREPIAVEGTARDPREPAEDAERLVATPSDHYGLCVDFELARDSAQP